MEWNKPRETRRDQYVQFQKKISDFFGWSNWLIMVVTVTAQFLLMLRSVANASHGIASRRLVCCGCCWRRNHVCRRQELVSGCVGEWVSDFTNGSWFCATFCLFRSILVSSTCRGRKIKRVYMHSYNLGVLGWGFLRLLLRLQLRSLIRGVPSSIVEKDERLILGHVY